MVQFLPKPLLTSLHAGNILKPICTQDAVMNMSRVVQILFKWVMSKSKKTADTDQWEVTA